MPIYEYECPSHGRYEVSQRITESALTTCTQPDCSQPVRKLISHSSFALKGSGWYMTDYGRGGTPPAAKPAESKEKSNKPAAAEKPAPACGTGACAAGCPAAQA